MNFSPEFLDWLNAVKAADTEHSEAVSEYSRTDIYKLKDGTERLVKAGADLREITSDGRDKFKFESMQLKGLIAAFSGDVLHLI